MGNEERLKIVRVKLSLLRPNLAKIYATMPLKLQYRALHSIEAALKTNNNKINWPRGVELWTWHYFRASMSYIEHNWDHYEKTANNAGVGILAYYARIQS